MNFSDLIEKFGIYQQFDKKTHVFSQGENNQYIHLIQEGILKAYYLDESGKEYIKSFLFPGDSIASSQALSGRLCSFSLQCLKNVTLIKLPYQKVREAAAENLDTANEIIELLMAFAMKKEQREFELLCLTAEQRYEKLLAKSQNISELITQNDIARYLGITPVALSRIKHNPKL